MTKLKVAEHHAAWLDQAAVAFRNKTLTAATKYKTRMNKILVNEYFEGKFDVEQKMMDSRFHYSNICLIIINHEENKYCKKTHLAEFFFQES